VHGLVGILGTLHSLIILCDCTLQHLVFKHTHSHLTYCITPPTPLSLVLQLSSYSIVCVFTICQNLQRYSYLLPAIHCSEYHMLQPVLNNVVHRNLQQPSGDPQVDRHQWHPFLHSVKQLVSMCLSLDHICQNKTVVCNMFMA